MAGGGAAGGAFTIEGGGDVMVWDGASTIILSVPAAESTKISDAVCFFFFFGLAVKPESLVATAAAVVGPSPAAAHGAAPAGAQATPDGASPFQRRHLRCEVRQRERARD